ncbi:MAG TPA: hypothetical protein VNX46_03165 [Candidatus Acidoferrum sp.]|jgi:hypothetical protein|nr:hypothetical protein [Candidatus Acidoferrum sp.]
MDDAIYGWMKPNAFMGFKQGVSGANLEVRTHWKKDSQISEAGRKSQKPPMPVVGNKPYGKSRINYFKN